MLRGLCEIIAGLGDSGTQLKTQVIPTLTPSQSCSRLRKKVRKFNKLVATWGGEIQDVESAKLPGISARVVLMLNVYGYEEGTVSILSIHSFIYSVSSC